MRFVKQKELKIFLALNPLKSRGQLERFKTTSMASDAYVTRIIEANFRSKAVFESQMLKTNKTGILVL